MGVLKVTPPYVLPLRAEVALIAEMPPKLTCLAVPYRRAFNGTGDFANAGAGPDSVAIMMVTKNRTSLGLAVAIPPHEPILYLYNSN